MAITKVSYTRSKAGAKASLDYYTHRPNRDGERQSRDLFGPDGPTAKMHGYRLIARASWDMVFFRIALSPDPNTEDAKRDLNNSGTHRADDTEITTTIETEEYTIYRNGTH